MNQLLKKQIITYLKNISILMLVFISILGCVSKFDIYNNKIIYGGNNFIYTLLLIGYFYLLKNTLKDKEKKLNIITIIFSCIFTIIYISSYLTANYFTNSYMPNSTTFICFISVKILAIFILSYTIIKQLYIKLNNININNSCNKYELKIFSDNKKSILFVAIIIFAFYVPYIIHSYPGNLTYDFAIQIRQALGYEQIVNHHPYIHTLFVRFMFENWKILNGKL